MMNGAVATDQARTPAAAAMGRGSNLRVPSQAKVVIAACNDDFGASKIPGRWARGTDGVQGSGSAGTRNSVEAL